MTRACTGTLALPVPALCVRATHPPEVEVSRRQANAQIDSLTGCIADPDRLELVPLRRTDKTGGTVTVLWQTAP